jgi:prepilin-type N-terminal cleavage/methylation domain-containing protein
MDAMSARATVMKPAHDAAFTLVELMIVLAVLGVLAALAIPAFQKYMVKAKTAEAPVMLRKLMDAASAYFAVDHADSNGQSVAAQFPATTGWYPAQLPVGTKVLPGNDEPAAADKESWNQLRFSLAEPVQFRYRFATTGLGTSSRADIAAESQLVVGHTCRIERSAWTRGGNTLELHFSELKIVAPPY